MRLKPGTLNAVGIIFISGQFLDRSVKRSLRENSLNKKSRPFQGGFRILK
jgi:hypothetical protein